MRLFFLLGRMIEKGWVFCKNKCKIYKKPMKHLMNFVEYGKEKALELQVNIE